MYHIWVLVEAIKKGQQWWLGGKGVARQQDGQEEEVAAGTKASAMARW